MSFAAPSLADQVIAACEKEWDAHKSNCSGFVKAVGTDLGIHLVGQANDIILFLRANWQSATGGRQAAQLAADGMLVIGGLEDQPNGHIVVVVRGPLNRDKYPTAYWGQLGGVGKKSTTINWSWSVKDRDRVEYYYYDVGRISAQTASPVQARMIGWSLEGLARSIKGWL